VRKAAVRDWKPGGIGGTAPGRPVKFQDPSVHMVSMGNAVTYSTITAASAAAIVWASQFVQSHILPAFESVTAVLDGIG
jgi:hypothetical protein